MIFPRRLSSLIAIMTKKPFLLFLLALSLLFFVRPAGAISLGQVDDFEDGGLAGWTNGSGGAPPVTNINTGGPAGAGDNYIRMTADGAGPGGRLTMFNFQQWIGNYIGAGVNRIEIDLINQGAVNLSIRLAFQEDNIMGAPGYVTPAMLLTPGSGWQHFSIAITAANLIAVGPPPPAPFNTFFTNFNAQMRIIHEVGTSNLNGDVVVGQLGIDNIRAVPEPTTLALAAGGLALFGLRLRRAKRGTLRR
ncbi:MAG TPA: PEP-CTERM sorting domain-containing protein [Chthoniobacterales bacterium]|nr:PEP-CTERM sorting domain-containing protein [Chthoniobacterales bacterium]